MLASEYLRRHGGRRRLAVRRRHQGDAAGEPRGELVDSTRIELPEGLPRDRCSAATSRKARDAAEAARGRRLECESNAHRGRAYRQGGERLLWRTCRICRTL